MIIHVDLDGFRGSSSMGKPRDCTRDNMYLAQRFPKGNGVIRRAQASTNEQGRVLSVEGRVSAIMGLDYMGDILLF